MGILFFTLFLFIMQAAPPVPRQAANNPAQAATNPQKQAKRNQAPSLPASAIPDTAPSQKDENSSSEIKTTNDQKPIRVAELPPVSITSGWRDNVGLIFSFILVVVTAIQACFLYRTLKFLRIQSAVMQRQTMHIARQALSMRRQTTHLRNSVIQARKGARAAKVSADAAKVSADALINSERARIVAEFIQTAVKYGNEWHRIESYGPVAMSHAEVLAGKHLSYQLKITNIGRTPAEVFLYKMNWGALIEGTLFSPEGLSSSRSQSINEFFAEGESRIVHLFNVKELFGPLLSENEKGAICATVEYGDTVSAPENREHMTFVHYHCPDAMSQLQRINTQTKYT
jgi:hypothetical protein